MATIDTIIPKIFARAMIKLRRNASSINLVNRSYENDFKTKGDRVKIPIGIPVASSSVTPSMTFPTPAASSLAEAEIVLDQWKMTSAQIKDDEIAKADVDGIYIPKQIQECIAPLIDDVHAHVISQYKKVYGLVGTAGTTPFASSSDILADGNLVLRQQLCPQLNKKALIDLLAARNIQKLAELKEAQKAGDARMLREGQIGRLLGFDIEDANVMPTHASTALSAGAATINGVQAINAGSTDGGRTGTISIAKLTNTAALVEGDIIEFTVGGVVQQHVVTANTTLIVGNTSVPVAPALRVATAGAEAVTLRASHAVNLLFNPDAFALCVRPAADFTMNGEPGQIYTYTQPDPFTGLAIRVQVVRGFMMRAYYFDILWGSACPRPELACRLIG